MKKIIIFLLPLCFYLYLSSNNQVNSNFLYTSNDTIRIVVKELAIDYPIVLSQSNHSVNNGWGDLGKKYTIHLTNGIDTLSFKHWKHPKEHVLLTNGKDSIDWFINAFGKERANFPLIYQNKHNQQSAVLVPEVYELANIIIALTEVGQQNKQLVTQSEYFAEVQNYFAKWQNHEVVQTVNQALKDDPSIYLWLKNDGLTYQFQGNKLLKNNIYYDFEGKFGLNNLLTQLEDFAQLSNFRKFYQDHMAFYRRLVMIEEQFVPIDNMWHWLEKYFPNRYNSHKVIFSPLTGGWHTTISLEDNNYSETLILVSAPFQTRQNAPSQFEWKMNLEKIIFTELNHNYVNPVSDSLRQEINTAMPKLQEWYDSQKYGGYNTSYDIFNEYMTFSLFNAYVMENYSSTEFEQINKRVENFMIDNRLFLKFKDFNQHFLTLWQKKTPEEPIFVIYHQMLDWMKKQVN